MKLDNVTLNNVQTASGAHLSATDTNDQMKYSSMTTADSMVTANSLAPKDLYACHYCCGPSSYGNQHLRTSTNLSSSWVDPRNLGHTARDAFL